MRSSGLSGPVLFVLSVYPVSPDGFEGLPVIPEELRHDDLAFSERQDLTELQIRHESRLFAGVALSYSQDHGVTGVDQILEQRPGRPPPSTGLENLGKDCQRKAKGLTT